MSVLYFDNAATTKVKYEVLQEMMPYLSEKFGNSSSVYSLGRHNKKAIEEAREKVAYLIGAKPKEIYFTSGGSESDNMALKGFMFANRSRGNHIITSKIEHPAILESCKNLERKGFQTTYINVDREGFIDLQELRKNITNESILISVMFANNEIGTIEPIREISKIARANNIAFHTDAVQAVGNVEIDVKELGIDMLSLSGHKIYGPKGIGVLYVRDGIDIERLIDGGHQERNRRGGTENVSAIVGIGKAAELAKNNMKEHIKKLQSLRDYFIKEIENNFEDAKLNGARKERLPGNANFSFNNIDGNEILYGLDSKEICISTGSACTSNDVTPSHVLKSIGLDEKIANGTIRVTFGDENDKNDVEILIRELKNIIKNRTEENK